MYSPKSQAEDQSYLAIFLVGFLCLVYELIQVRMLSFFLGNSVDFLAIPIALLGLALGSIFCHFVYKGDKRRLISICTALVFPSLLVVFLVFFHVVDTYFSEIHIALLDLRRDSIKLVVYSAIFLGPYFLFGALLASYFAIGADRIGRLYFFDLLGAAIGCFVTPILFTYTDLPPAIVMLLFAAFLLLLSNTMRYKKTAVTIAAVILAVIQVLSLRGDVFKEHPDPYKLSRYILNGWQKSGLEEADVTWNEIARTSLIRADTRNANASRDVFAIVQDNGLSNVLVYKYNRKLKRDQQLEKHLHHSLAYAMGMEPKSILVMFAGIGRDMITFNAISKEKANIVGVEINRTVVDLVHHPLLFTKNLRNFTARKNIHLIQKEGRDFLNSDRHQYDLIYVANNGAVHANRTGHTRKFLDTYEAMESYLDHLAPGGLIIFTNQPVQDKIPSFKQLFAERKMGDIKNALYAFGVNRSPTLDSLLVKPDGFTKEQVKALKTRTAKLKGGRGRALYSPYKRKSSRVTKLVNLPMKKVRAKLITDDRPFSKKINLKDFHIPPKKNKLRNHVYVSNWIKIFTVLFFVVIVLIVILAARFLGGKDGRIPLPWLVYFLISGIAYMCVEIGLIAKTELFLGSPLYAIAVNLALFLFANAIGSLLQGRFSIMRGPKTLVLVTVGAIAWSIVSADICNEYFLSLPIALKILGVAICVLPAGIALGMYYPFGVSKLVEGGLESTVPMTYGISTLSSVLGSAYAMTAIINFGFSRVVILGAAGYASVALVYLFAKRTVKSA